MRIYHSVKSFIHTNANPALRQNLCRENRKGLAKIQARELDIVLLCDTLLSEHSLESYDMYFLVEKPKKISRSLYEMKVNGGASFNPCLKEALRQSLRLNAAIRFTFSEIVVTVKADSDPKLIHRDWERAQSKLIPNKVGPYPRAQLTKDEIARDAKLRKEHSRKFDDELAAMGLRRLTPEEDAAITREVLGGLRNTGITPRKTPFA